MVNLGPMLHCEKYSVNLKINHGQAWFNVTFKQGLSEYENQQWSMMFILVFIIFILGFIYLGFIILVPWV